MRVIALEIGFYEGARKRVGAEFDFDEKHMVKDAQGKAVLPKWVTEKTADSQAQVQAAKKAAEDKDLNAAKAAAGPKRGDRPAVKEVPTTAFPNDHDFV